MPCPPAPLSAPLADQPDRRLLSHHRSLFLLSMLMIESLDENEIVRIAVGSVSTLGGATGLGALLERDGTLVGAPIGSFDSDDVVTQLPGLANTDGEVPVSYTHLTLPTNREV